MEYYNSAISEQAVEVRVYKGRLAVLENDWQLEKIKSPYSRVYFVKKAQGATYYKDQTVQLQDNTIYIIPPELEFSGRAAYLEKLYFHISVLNFDRYDIYAGLNEIYTLPCSEEEYESAFHCLMSESYLDKVKLKRILLGVFERMQETYHLPDVQITQHSELVRNILTYIQNNLSLKLRVPDIAEALYISESKVRNTFRKEMGIPIGQYIDDMVYTTARQLLAFSNMSISQISASLGFCDQFYFSRQFSKKFGRTPSQFRRNIKS